MVFQNNKYSCLTVGDRVIIIYIIGHLYKPITNLTWWMAVHLVYPQVQASWLDFQLSLEEVEPKKYTHTQDPFLVLPSRWMSSKSQMRTCI